VLTCPLCKKPIKTLVRECPTCRTDLSLLADFMTQVEAGLRRAEEHARAGRLGDAMWAAAVVLALALLIGFLAGRAAAPAPQQPPRAVPKESALQ
jgi:hypothetical protein